MRVIRNVIATPLVSLQNLQVDFIEAGRTCGRGVLPNRSRRADKPS